eukprot:SAG22_NODE_227_length_14641_cov_11.007908_2_plen_213_part_00
MLARQRHLLASGIGTVVLLYVLHSYDMSQAAGVQAGLIAELRRCRDQEASAAAAWDQQEAQRAAKEGRAVWSSGYGGGPGGDLADAPDLDRGVDQLVAQLVQQETDAEAHQEEFVIPALPLDAVAEFPAEEEKRVDPTSADAGAYTRQQFIDVYGGTQEWDAAGAVRANPPTRLPEDEDFREDLLQMLMEDKQKRQQAIENGVGAELWAGHV